MNAKNVKEDIISLKFYHERLVDEFWNICKAAEESNIDKSVFRLLPNGMGHSLSKETINKLLKSGGGFGGMLAKLYEEEKNKNNDEMHFDKLFVSLCRIIPTVDRIGGQLCDMNIGKGIVTGSENVKPMQRALSWLYIYSSKDTDLEYQDIQRTQRLVRNIIKEGCDLDNYELNGLMKEVERVFDDAGVNDKVSWIKIYKDRTKVLLEATFNCYGLLHKYFDIMRGVDREQFETELLANGGTARTQKSDIRRDYQRIYMLALTVLTVFLRHFVSFAKISDINFPHAMFADSDLISIDLSGSNFISSDLSRSDITGAILRNSDISVSNLTYCNAQNTDLSGCKLNSSNLIGSDFTNALLTDAQLSAVRFRDGRLDNEIDFYAKCKSIEEIQQHIEKKSEYHNFWSDNSYKNITRNLFDGFSVDKQDFDNNITTPLWKATSCRSEETRISFKTSLDEACEIVETQLKDYFNAYRYRSVPYSFITDPTILRNNVACFKFATMTGSFLPDSDLSFVNFDSAMLSGADLSGGKFWYTNFRNASLVGANAGGTDFYGVSLTGANCGKANFINATLINCDFVGCDLSGALMIDASVINEKYCEEECGDKRKPYVNLIYNESSPLSSAIDDRYFGENNSLCDANLDGITATNSIFSGLNMDRSSWQDAKMKKAIIFNCVARWTFFNNVDFSYAILLGVSFHQASLANVLLPKSRLFDCDMSGVKLNRANLTGCKLEKVIFQNTDLGGANFSRSQIKNCCFNDVNFSGTNISETVFENVIFENIDFSDCLGLANARFYNCAFGSNCNRLEYQLDTKHKANKNFMSIIQNHTRMKFFREVKAVDSEVDTDRYTSLSYYLARK